MKTEHLYVLGLAGIAVVLIIRASRLQQPKAMQRTSAAAPQKVDQILRPLFNIDPMAYTSIMDQYGINGLA